MKSAYDVEEYSFGQTTLEQVFIAFAKLQEEADRAEESGEKQAEDDAARKLKRMTSATISVSSVDSQGNRKHPDC